MDTSAKRAARRHLISPGGSGLVASACQQGNVPAQQGAQADPNGELVVPLGAEPDTIDPQKESFVDEVG